MLAGLAPRPSPTSRAWLLWGWGLCALFIIAAVLCIAWEPVRLDGWYIWFQYRARPFSLAGWLDVVRFNYLHGNPRFGENITNALYAPGSVHVVAHAALMTFSFWILATLGLGRRPQRHDVLFITTLLAMYLVAIPRVGPMLFYRPFFGNYVVGAMPAFGFLAMCHCYLRGTIQARSAWLLVPVFFLGVLGGLCNEHTGPAFVLAGATAVYLAWRQGRVPLWMLAGVLGLGCGFLGLFFAPGQMERYAGAGKVGVMTTLLSRSFGASLQIVVRAPFTAFWLAPWAVIAAAALGNLSWSRCRATLMTQQAKFFGLALGFATIVGGTLLAAPLNGPRLYYATATALLCAAAAWVLQLVSSSTKRDYRRRIALAMLNTVVILGSTIGLVHTVWRERPVFARRMTVLLAAQSGAPGVEVPSVPKGFRQWTLGEDFNDHNLRVALANYFNIGEIVVTIP